MRNEMLNELKLEDLQGGARELAETIGMDAFRRLVDVYGGTGRVYIPQADKLLIRVPFPVSWTVKMKKKQKETQDILSYHTQAAGCSDKARAKASGGRQPIEECGRTGL